MKKVLMPLGPVLVGLLALSCLGLPPAAAVNPASATTAIVGLPAPAPDLQTTLPTTDADWCRRQVFYHVWVAAFADSDGDGLGDLKGLTSRLDYLEDLGVTALWLNPFFKSASKNENLHGYDAVDHYTVDPRLGTNQDVRDLLAAAHRRGLRVIFDFVPNHVSDQHPWFQKSREGDKEFADWFLWSNEPPESGWANWGGDPAWHQAAPDSQGRERWYYGLFWSGMPDLNYRNPQVRLAMAKVARYWLDQGFDGLRIDAVRYVYETPDGSANGIAEIVPETFDFFAEFRHQVLDPYRKLGCPKFMVGENWIKETDSLRAYLNVKGQPTFDMMLDFPFGYLAYQAVSYPEFLNPDGALASHWKETGTLWPELGGWSGTFLNNHDNYQSRPATAFSYSLAKARLAVALQMTGVGTPFFYYGNEIDMPGLSCGDDRQFRRPMDWSKLPALQKDPAAVWQLTRTLMQLRKSRASLQVGDFQVCAVGQSNLRAYSRSVDGETTLVVINPTDQPLSGQLGQTFAQAKVLAGKPQAVAWKAGRLEVTKLEPFGYVVLEVSGSAREKAGAEAR